MKLILSLLLLISCGFAAVYGQSPPQDQSKQVNAFIRENNAKQANNPDGVSFTVRLKNDQGKFHQGEVITLELSFAAPKPKTFTIDAATYDRSGRLNIDRFVVDRRNDVVDPLYDYFNSEFMLFLTGGLRGIPDLTDKPYVITAEVNEWLRFEKPGRYRLYVVSYRIRGESVRGGVVSNVVEFEILPRDKKWANQKLNDSITALSKKEGDRYAACRTLRFLGTTAAATEMRQRFRGDDNKCDWEYKFGLIGSPHRDFVIRDMESALGSPEHPVTSSFIATLAMLEFTRQTAVPPRPGPYPSSGNEDQIRQWENQTAQRRGIHNRLAANFVRQVVLAIAQKQGQARAVSLQTILDYRSELNASGFTQWSTLVAAIPEIFHRLSPRDQARMLNYHGKLIASSAMVPVLRAVLKDLENKPDNYSLEEPFSIFDRIELQSITVRRLYELSPDEGRQLILDEIRNPKPRVYEPVLRLLPDETLPEFDRPLLANLEQARKTGNGQTEVIINLIERYATAEILPELRAFYEARDTARLNCPAQAALLAYFLRVDASIGADYLNKALATRSCSHSLLGDVALVRMSEEVEAAAIASLEAEDLQLVANAAEALEKYGSAEAEKALWRRLEKCHAEMQNPREVDRQENLERVLSKALSEGRAWLSDPEKLTRLRDLCTTKTVCDAVDERIRTWDYNIFILLNSLDGEVSLVDVAHYQFRTLDGLKQKLIQFPKGTSFTWTGPEDLFQEFKIYLEEHSMKLKREPALPQNPRY